MVDPALALLVFTVLVVGTAAVVWPRRGVLARLVEYTRLTERVRLEDAVKHVYMAELAGGVCTLESLAGRLGISTHKASVLLTRLTDLGLVQIGETGPVLSEDGLESALRTVRTHRLWERYLADRTGVPAVDWHDEAEHMEHNLTADEAEVLAARLGHPNWDPHGDPIPTAEGHMPDLQHLSLTGAPAGRTVEITHLEDEPREIYDRLLTMGLALGGRLEILARDDRGLRVRAAGEEFQIEAVGASNVSVRVLPVGERAGGAVETLADLQPGEAGSVVGLSSACRGPQRRRLLDLGVVPGTVISAEMSSATGDPMAYLIRGALIAFRREQAGWVTIERVAESVEVAS
ncbi:MAG: FeoA domain-containing protein [Gemmatimonadetes bacterium]|nr:FeoA domain-containing protein [Gemmatimonadota bacterium]